MIQVGRDEKLYPTRAQHPCWRAHLTHEAGITASCMGCCVRLVGGLAGGGARAREARAAGRRGGGLALACAGRPATPAGP